MPEPRQPPPTTHPSRRRRPCPPLAGWLASGLLLTGLAAQTTKPPIQGITVSTHGIGRDWGTDRMTECVAQIERVGANWIAVHPYARIHRDGRVTWRSFTAAKPPALLTRPIREAHARGIKVLIKPHLAYWGSPFRWRGEISFATTEQWRTFFDSYRRWIVAIATACKDADGFAVGTELDKTIDRVDEWRRIIGAVRKATKAPLTYAANWTDYRRIQFWDALDIIGIQAYFPLTEQRNADAATLRQGWRSTMQTLRRYAAAQHRNIVFTELGYTTSFAAAARPWDSLSDGPDAAAYQRLCMSIALQAVADEPRVEGAFLWKWFPPPRPVGRDFPLATPAMRATIRNAWGR